MKAHGIKEFKICNKCLISKHKSKFYIRSNHGAIPTLLSICKKCSSIRCLQYQQTMYGKEVKRKIDKKWRESDRGKEIYKIRYSKVKVERRTDEGRAKRRLEAVKYRNGNGKEISKKINRKWLENNRNKHRAQKIANYHIKELKPCLVCKAFPTHKHHSDYNKPKEIIFLCPLHHTAVHKGELKI